MSGKGRMLKRRLLQLWGKLIHLSNYPSVLEESSAKWGGEK
jgi:hypothetical protein